MDNELTQKLYEKYPAIFAGRCGIPHGDGWYGIIDTMCAAMSEAYKTCIHIDAEHSLEIKCPQVVALQIKEKYGTLRFYYRLEFEPNFHEMAFGENPIPECARIADRYHSFMAGIEHMAKTLSARTCEETGKEGELHQSGNWFRTLNREFAKTDPHCRRRNYIPVADFPPPP